MTEIINPKGSSEEKNDSPVSGLGGVTGILFLILLIFFLLNYFGILPISKTLPFLSFLPTTGKSVKEEVRTTKKTPPRPTEKPTIPNLTKVICPVKGDLCKKGAILILPEKDKTSTFSGIIYDNLPNETEILGVRTGAVQVKMGEGGSTIVSIIHKENRLLINYEFPKDAFKPNYLSKVSKEGEVIGTIVDSTKIFPNLGGNPNFMFSIQILDTKSYFRITTSEDKKFIEPI